MRTLRRIGGFAGLACAAMTGPCSAGLGRAASADAYRTGLASALALVAEDMEAKGRGCLQSDLLPKFPSGPSFSSSSKVDELGKVSGAVVDLLARNAWPKAELDRLLRPASRIANFRVVKMADKDCDFIVAIEAPRGNAERFVLRVSERAAGGTGLQAAAYLIRRRSADAWSIEAKTSRSMVVN